MTKLGRRPASAADRTAARDAKDLAVARQGTELAKDTLGRKSASGTDRTAAPGRRGITRGEP